MDKIDVTSLEIRDYAQSLGWQLVKEALADGLFVLNSPFKDKGDYTQLIFPREFHEFSDYVYSALVQLSQFYSMPIGKIQDEIREVNDDVICLRYHSENKLVNSISFNEAVDAMAATRQMILSAASTVVNPVIFHQKLNRVEPQELIKKTKFRHTQEGSFIIKVSVPFEPIDLSNTLFAEMKDVPAGKPLGRQAIEVMSISSNSIRESIDSNTIADLYKGQVESPAPFLSYNFCDSLLKIFDEEREIPFELIFNWSKSSLLNMPAPSVPTRVTFPYSYKAKIDELRNYLSPRKQDFTGVFYGTVESLNGDIGSDGRRSGEVVFALLIETGLVKARANLKADDYNTAITAHQRGGAYVLIKAKLHWNSRSSNTLEEITELKLAEN